MTLGPLISAQQLKECLDEQTMKLRVVDATWFLPNADEKGPEVYLQGHIPGAVHFDVDTCITPTDYDIMLPSESVFADYVGKLGIDNETHVVVYNNHPTFALFSAPRVWWIFRCFGHECVSVIDGGLRAWRDAGYDIATGKETVPPAVFTAKFNPSFIKSFEDIVANIEKKSFQLVDARPPGRFEGTAPEPREDIKPGHIPGAMNLPFANILGPYTGPDGKEMPQGAVKTPELLQKLFADRGVDMKKPFTTSCGTGMSACCLVYAAYLCGKKDVTVYDGSWVEWYQRSTPEQRVQCPGDPEKNDGTSNNSSSTRSKPEKSKSSSSCVLI